MIKGLYIVTVLFSGLLVIAADCQAQMQSTNYRMPSSVYSGGGAASASASYRLDATSGQPSPPGITSNSNYVVASGFWYVLLETVVDSDGDGIDDQWETYHFGNLTTATATSDFDRDGYSDLQEYKNNLAAITDPDGYTFNPKIVNAPWGTGYDPRLRSNFLAPILIYILESSK